MFVANGTGIAWSGGGSTVVFCIGGSLKADGCTTGGVEGGMQGGLTGCAEWVADALSDPLPA